MREAVAATLFDDVPIPDDEALGRSLQHGENAKHDLELYLDAAHAHPGRVPVILIRNVSPPAQHAALEQRAQRSVPPGCRVLVFQDTQRAIDLCAELGFWRPAPPKTLPPPPGP